MVGDVALTLLFASARLYADAGLQGVYFVLQFYGWYRRCAAGRPTARR
jgi:hypothetical protein